MKGAFVYILTNAHHTTLYVGVTSNLLYRTGQHKERIFPKSFTARYNLCKLVYFETHDTILEAIQREKQLKAGSRKKKVDLIEEFNKEWKDLYPMLIEQGWFIE